MHESSSEVGNRKRLRDLGFWTAMVVLLVTKGVGGSLNSAVEGLGLASYYGVVVALVVTVACLLVWIPLYFSKPTISDLPLHPPKGVWIFLFIFLAAAFAERVSDIRINPIDVDQADMLPNVIAGFQDLEEGRSPYRPHSLSNGTTIPHYYPPFLWAGYFPFYRLGLDVRSFNWLAQLGLCLLLVWLLVHKRGNVFEGIQGEMLTLCCLGVFLFSKLARGQCLHVHTAGIGILLALFLFLLVNERYRAANFVLPFLLLSRETALILVLPYWGFLFQRSRLEFFRSLFTTVFIAGPIVLLFMSLPDSDFFGAARHYAGLLRGANPDHPGYVGYPGLAWILLKLKLDRWQFIFQGLGLLLSAILLLRRPPTTTVGVMSVMGISYLFFIQFAAITFHYLYIEVLILLMFQVTAIATGRVESLKPLN